MLAYLPVETVIKAQQRTYYQVFRQADLSSDGTCFIEFLLGAMAIALQDAIAVEQKARVLIQTDTRVEKPLTMPEQILNLLKAQPALTLADVARHLGRSVSTIERAVAKLKQQHRLTYHGPKKGGYWQVH